MSNRSNAGKTLKVISWITHFFALSGACVVMVLGIVASRELQTLRSQLDQVQKTLLSTIDEIAAQQAHMQELDVWATDLQVLCDDQSQEIQSQELCSQRLVSWTTDVDAFCSDQNNQGTQHKAFCEQKLAVWIAELEVFCDSQNAQDVQLKRFCETNPTLAIETAPQVKTDLGTLLSAVQDSILWGMLGITVITTLILVALVVSGLYRQVAAKRDLELHAELLIEEYSRGYQDGLEHTAKVLDEDTSVLRNVAIWLHNYQSGRRNAEPEDVDVAAAIFQQLLSRLEGQLKLEPIGHIGAPVEFRVENYRTHQALSPGDRARIIEPGWRLGTKTLRRPLVGE